MNTCHHVPDNIDINDALSKTFSQGNPTLKLCCVYTDSRKNFRNLSPSRSYECGRRYMTCLEKTPTVQFILNQLNAGHALNIDCRVGSILDSYPGDHRFRLRLGDRSCSGILQSSYCTTGKFWDSACN